MARAMDRPALSPFSRRLALAVYCLICLLAVTEPGYARFGNAPRLVIGIPFSLAWVIGWVLLTFVVLTLFYLADSED